MKDNEHSVVKAEVGDEIQYEYLKPGHDEPCYGVATVLEVCEQGASFVVQGFFLIDAAHVLSVIPQSSSINDDQADEF